jgi:DNA-binding helix-turn-helix protein
MTDVDAFAQKIAEILEESTGEIGMSQNALAKKSGVSQAQISRIFSGKRDVSLTQLFSIALALGKSGSALLAEAEARLAAATEPTPTEEVAEVHTLPIHRRDIPPIPEGLAARRVPSSPAEDEEELPDFSQMAARTVSDEQYQRIMARKRFFDDLGEGVDYDPDGWAD